jgi:hypothetical protein
LTIWDVLFLDRSVVLFKAALAFIELVKDNLVKFDSLENFKNYLKDYFSKFKDISHLKFYLIMRRFEFNNDTLDKNRLLIEGPIIEHISKVNSIKMNKLREKTRMREDICDDDWPICIYECDSFYKVHEVFTFKSAGPPQLHENYFFKELDIDRKSVNMLKKKESVCINIVDYESALIERKPHCCIEKFRKKKNKKNYNNTSIDTVPDLDESLNISTGTGGKSIEGSIDQSSDKSSEKEKEVTGIFTNDKLSASDLKKKYKRYRMYLNHFIHLLYRNG